MESTLDLLRIKNALIAQQVDYVAFFPETKSQILAVVLSNDDIVLWKATIQNYDHIIKWIPWKNDKDSKIQAITFQPVLSESIPTDKIELLVITLSCVIYLLPIEKIIEGGTAHQRYSQFSLYPSCPFDDFVPTALVWWESSHRRHRDIAVIGGANGQVIFYSLTHAHYVATVNTQIKSPLTSLSICTDFLRDFSYLLITNALRQQWKLLLEKEVNGVMIVLIPFEESSSIQRKDNELVLRAHKTGLQQIRQKSVETFALLKQKLNESRKNSNERLKEGLGKLDAELPELISCSCEAHMSVQQYRNRRVLTGFFVADSILEVYLQNKDTITLLHHKLQTSPLVTSLLLTHTFIYVADIVDNQHTILIFSTRLSELKKSETADFNPASFVQSFVFPENERIIGLHKMEVKLQIDERFDPSSLYVNSDLLPSSQPNVLARVKQNSLEDEWNEACMVVTNAGVYIISLKDNPLTLASDSIKTDIKLVKRLPLIFNVPLSKIIELIADRYIEENEVDEALVLCNKFKCYSGKITLRLASFGFIEELLLYTENLLNQSDVDLPLVEKIHLSNFVVTCYCERYLRNSSNESIKNQFLQFLKTNRFYDEEVNIHILANYRMCEFLHFLIVSRGLYVDGAVALTNMIAHNLDDKLKNLHYYDGFWELFSEISMVDAFVLSPRTVHLHIYFLREHIEHISNEILERLYQFYHPMQPVLKPALYRMLKTPKDEHSEAYDFENDQWGSDANMYDWITNFVYLHIKLFKDYGFEKSLRNYITKETSASSVCADETSIVKSSEAHHSISPPVLCAGAAHAALIRNGSLVMWGQSAYGCLGSGPTLSQNCPPTLNSWFEDHRIRVKSVACGKHHTIALTENGVYAWGSSKFGQLGIGQRVNQSAYPRLVETLSSSVIVRVAAGQYHSLAVDANGRLWTWGWSVFGQLGHGDVDDQHYPKLVQHLEKKFIVYVSAGQAHSVALTKNGKLYTFGCNTYGQLGVGTTSKSTLPVKVFGIQESLILVATHYFHNLALSDSNRLYTWGCSPHILKLQSQSQKRARSNPVATGRRNEQPVVNLESRNSSDSDFVELSVSKTNENVIPEMTSLQIDSTKHLSPTLVDTSLVEGNIKQISCGLFHSALLTTNSQVYTWGRNTDGQLGNCKRQGEIPIPTPVYVVPAKLLSNKQQMEMLNRPLWSVQCGRDYTLVVELENRLFGWGNNSYGQLGSVPQEDFSMKRFLNGKFIVNKYTKRMIKWSHGGVNIIEKPVEFTNLPKFPFLFSNEEQSPDRYTQIECSLELPGFSRSRYPLQSEEATASQHNPANKMLHYYLECFHRYYNVDYILQTCADEGNLQAMAKICVLNYRFYEAFFYEVKALLTYVKERFCFNSFDEIHTADLSKKRLIPKCTEQREAEGTNDRDTVRLVTDFEFVEDVVVEAASLFEKFCRMVLEYTPDKIGSFLKQSISVWIIWQIPLHPLENMLLRNLEAIAYPFAVFLFCDRKKSRSYPSDIVSAIQNHAEKSVWKNKQHYLSTYLHKKYLSLVPSKTAVKNPYVGHQKAKMSYRNLYQIQDDSHLESDDPKYRLSADQILQHISVQFTLKLCNMIVESMSKKSAGDFEEFVRLLHEIVFSPSVLKSDDRTPDEVLSAVLSALQRSQTPRKKFIQISYRELCEKPIENKLVVFSCSHYYISQSDYEKEVSSVVGELDRLRLFSCSEVVNRLFSESNYTTCCPNCLFHFIESEVITKP